MRLSPKGACRRSGGRPPARRGSSVDHDNPLAEVYEDQLMAADLIVLNKTDLIGADAGERLKREVFAIVPRAVKVVAVQEGRVDADVLLGLGAAEDDLAQRPRITTRSTARMSMTISRASSFRCLRSAILPTCCALAGRRRDVDVLRFSYR